MGWVSAIGGLASAFLGHHAAKQASQQASQGFNYAKASPNVQQAQTAGEQAGGLRNALLGLGGDTQAAQDAFQHYLDSAGYGFRMQQGSEAITGNRAARGILDSGASARALEAYGQNIGGQYFDKYLGQLGGVQQAGLGSVMGVAGHGAAAGQQAGAYTMQGAGELASGLGVAAGGASDIIQHTNPGLYSALGGYVPPVQSTAG